MYTAHTAPQLGTRLGAIVQTAVFDSANGITRRSTQFRPSAPPALTNPQYLADLVQVRALGNAATVTSEHADIARFWQGKFDTVATLWNRTADELAMAGDRSVTDNARIFALLNVAL